MKLLRIFWFWRYNSNYMVVGPTESKLNWIRHFKIRFSLYFKTQRKTRRKLHLATHLVFVMSASWFECVCSTYQYSLLVRLCNNSDEILALRLETKFGIDSYSDFFPNIPLIFLLLCIIHSLWVRVANLSSEIRWKVDETACLYMYINYSVQI